MKTINSVIFGLAIVGAAFLLGNAYIQRAETHGTIEVTGLGTVDFVSDLIVWQGSFEAKNENMQQAYEELNNNKEVIKNYLASKGITADEMVFQAINTGYLYEDNYSPEGKYIGQVQIGYRLTQELIITSTDVEKVEKISREVTELLNQGIKFYSYSPSYYYTKLADLKLELIQKATEDAHTRAEKISQNSGSKLGKLIDARMGIFQITGQNSNEDYTWGGAFNTSSKNKTASITVSLEYQVK
ncbi:MAG: SIMPL domain-containing protein [Bacteroidales bacterium]|nr:SIMPL domain-containing protein [Bacteroidales bacterium]